MATIYHHLGLGDHIICNGLVRYYSAKRGRINLFCKNGNIENVSWMYRDCGNINLVPVIDDSDCEIRIASGSDEIIKIGFDKLNRIAPNNSFDRDFYRIAGIDFALRFSAFYYKRNLGMEETVYNDLNPSGGPFIFIHEDQQRGYMLNRSKISSKKTVILNDKKYLIFNYLYLIMKAEEVHFMQSSFKEFLSSYHIPNVKFYQHNYVRNYPRYLNSASLNPIIDID